MVSICFFKKCGPCDFVHTQLYLTVLYTEYTLQPNILNSWWCFGCQKFMRQLADILQTSPVWSAEWSWWYHEPRFCALYQLLWRPCIQLTDWFVLLRCRRMQNVGSGLKSAFYSHSPKRSTLNCCKRTWHTLSLLVPTLTPAECQLKSKTILLKSGNADLLLSAIDVCTTSGPGLLQTHLQSLKKLKKQCCSWFIPYLCIHPSRTFIRTLQKFPTETGIRKGRDIMSQKRCILYPAYER
jgi:hypothetical protein